MSQLEDRFDHFFGRLAALEVAVAGILATASEEQRAKVAAFLELANTGGLHAEASEHFLAGCEATTKKLL